MLIKQPAANLSVIDLIFTYYLYNFVHVRYGGHFKPKTQNVDEVEASDINLLITHNVNGHIISLMFISLMFI